MAKKSEANGQTAVVENPPVEEKVEDAVSQRKAEVRAVLQAMRSGRGSPAKMAENLALATGRWHGKASMSAPLPGKAGKVTVKDALAESTGYHDMRKAICASAECTVQDTGTEWVSGDKDSKAKQQKTVSGAVGAIQLTASWEGVDAAERVIDTIAEKGQL